MAHARGVLDGPLQFHPSSDSRGEMLLFDAAGRRVLAHGGDHNGAAASGGREEDESVVFCGQKLSLEPQRIDFDEGYYVGTVDEEGQMCGYGKAVWVSGDSYEGEWLHDLMHGRGIYRWADGDWYEGQYVNGSMNGHGVMHDSTGVYNGQWLDDMRHGRGRMEYSGGNAYDGEWMSNMRHGTGKISEENGVTYEGEFVYNVKEGRGLMINGDGDVYDGEFVQGKPHGRGTYRWADGAKYVGEFRDGLKHGRGCERMANGDWVGGTFAYGEPDCTQVRHSMAHLKMEVEELDNDVAMAAMEPLNPEALRRLAEGEPVRRASTGGGDESSSSSSSSIESPLAGATSFGQGVGNGSNGPAMELRASEGASRVAAVAAETVATSAVGGDGGGGGAAARGSLMSAPTLMPPQPLVPVTLSDKDLEGWTQVKLIGKGSFGAVYEALLTSGRTVCCKVIELGTLTSREELDKLRNEIALMKRLRHVNIVQYYGSQEDQKMSTINIFMELVSGGSLNTFVKKFKSIPFPTMRQWAYQMVCGVKYLHDCGIIHRDIKGDNVLVTQEGVVKLADFGCSKAIDDVCSKTHGCQTMVGTPYWMAPEVIKCESGGYGTKSDIWSIGCTVVEMITGKPPWPECNSMWAAVYKIANSTGLPTEIPKDLDPQLMSFLEHCFEREPSKRASVDVLLQHPFLQLLNE